MISLDEPDKVVCLWTKEQQYSIEDLLSVETAESNGVKEPVVVNELYMVEFKLKGGKKKFEARIVHIGTLKECELVQQMKIASSELTAKKVAAKKVSRNIVDQDLTTRNERAELKMMHEKNNQLQDMLEQERVAKETIQTDLIVAKSKLDEYLQSFCN